MAVLRRDKCITLRTDDLWLVVWRTTLQPQQPLAHVGTGASVVSVRWGSLSISTLHLGTLAMAELCSGQGQPQSEDNLIPRPVSPVTLVSVPMKQRDYPLLFVSDSLFTHLPIIFTHNIIWWSFLRLLFLHRPDVGDGVQDEWYCDHPRKQRSRVVARPSASSRARWRKIMRLAWLSSSITAR